MNSAAIGAVIVPPHPFFDFNDAPDRIERRHDKDELRNRLLDQLEAVLTYLFPRGKRQGSRFVVGNVQGDAGDSLVIELEGPKRGVWIDFATGESGDVLALWAAVRGFAVPRDFGELLDDVGDWLVVPTSFMPAPAKSSVAHDTLGPHTAKWDYRSADGELLACVYRYDTPEGKQYRPWDVASRQTRMPDPRPLYHLPAVAKADTVVLVEGEKCADALMHIGIVATTAMGGAATSLAKTDWSPLAGKTVIVWPDNDEAGARYANAVIPKLQEHRREGSTHQTTRRQAAEVGCRRCRGRGRRCSFSAGQRDPGRQAISPANRSRSRSGAPANASPANLNPGAG